MKRIVKYTALDSYYSDITQTYIGSSSTELDNIQYETEEFMQGEKSFYTIYKSEIIKSEYEN